MRDGRAGTIFALSSGNPPAAIAIVRVSGPAAAKALEALGGRVPQPRRASLQVLRDAAGEELDRALTLWFPGPDSSTGEDHAEFHLHGGRSVVATVLAALSEVEGLRPAAAGEFTRRAFENGRIDLAEAEGLADLLTAETQSQRRAALATAGGALSRRIEAWQSRLLALSAALEASLDFAEEDDVEEELAPEWKQSLQNLAGEIETLLAQPPAERLRDGIRIVIAGPPNAGKSSLLNYLAGREAAITSATPGTTRDLVEAPTALGGTPFLLVDTAGLRESQDEIESIGVGRARQSLEAADLVLWLGSPSECPRVKDVLLVRSKSDLQDGREAPEVDVHVSVVTGEGMDRLVAMLVERAKALLPQEGSVALNARHRAVLSECLWHLKAAPATRDPLIASEELRQARNALDRVTGRAGVENMLDALFGNFCIGK